MLIYGQGPSEHKMENSGVKWVPHAALSFHIPLAYLLSTSSLLTLCGCSCLWYLNKRNGVIRSELFCNTLTNSIHSPALLVPCFLLWFPESPCSNQSQAHHSFVSWEDPFFFFFASFINFASHLFIYFCLLKIGIKV